MAALAGAMTRTAVAAAANAEPITMFMAPPGDRSNFRSEARRGTSGKHPVGSRLMAVQRSGSLYGGGFTDRAPRGAGGKNPTSGLASRRSRQKHIDQTWARRVALGSEPGSPSMWSMLDGVSAGQPPS